MHPKIMAALAGSLWKTEDKGDGWDEERLLDFNPGCCGSVLLIMCFITKDLGHRQALETATAPY